MTAPVRKLPYWLFALIAIILVFGGFLRAGLLHLPGYHVPGGKRIALRIAQNAPPVSLADFKDGFAIPINIARDVIDQIVDHGKVIRGYLGVTIQGVDPDMAKMFGLNQGGGALVGDVSRGGPADKAGLQRGDIILELNGTQVKGPDDLNLRVSEMAPGSVAKLQIYRNGHTQEISVTLGEYPDNGQPVPSVEASGAASNGLQVQNLTPGLVQQFGLPAGSTGVVVTEVDPASAAAAAGVKPGDVIVEVNRKPVQNVNQYLQALAGTEIQPVLVRLNHGGTTRFVILKPLG